MPLNRLASISPESTFVKLLVISAVLSQLKTSGLCIAKSHFSIETLETRNSDSLDFYDVAVWSLKKALQEAYEAGHLHHNK